jgi:hypothetical protein
MTPTEQMHVQMKNRLSGAGANIEHGAVSVFNVALAGDLRGGQVAAANDLGVSGLRFFQSSEMPLGNDENVCRSLRINIFKCKDMLVFVNFFSGNLAANDAAEKAIVVVHAAHLRNDSIPNTKLSAVR